MMPLYQFMGECPAVTIVANLPSIPANKGRKTLAHKVNDELIAKLKEHCGIDYPRGYCHICNRYRFFQKRLDPTRVQIFQHSEGVCLRNRFDCARVKTRRSA